MDATDEVYREVRTRINQAYRDMARGDLESLMSLYAADAVIQSPGEPPLEGAARIRNFWRETFSAYRVEMVPTLAEVTLQGELVIVRGAARGDFKSKGDAPPIQVNSWFMQIYRRQAGVLVFWRGANGQNPEHVEH